MKMRHCQALGPLTKQSHDTSKAEKAEERRPDHPPEVPGLDGKETFLRHGRNAPFCGEVAAKMTKKKPLDAYQAVSVLADPKGFEPLTFWSVDRQNPHF